MGRPIDGGACHISLSGRVRKSLSTGGGVDRVVTRYANIQHIHLVSPSQRTCPWPLLPAPLSSPPPPSRRSGPSRVMRAGCAAKRARSPLVLRLTIAAERSSPRLPTTGIKVPVSAEMHAEAIGREGSSFESCRFFQLHFFTRRRESCQRHER